MVRPSPIDRGVGGYDGAFVAANLGWSCTVAVLPFATKVLAVLGIDRLAIATSIATSIGTIAATSACLSALSLLVWRQPSLRKEHIGARPTGPLSSQVTTGALFIALLVGVLIPAVTCYALLLLFLTGSVEKRLPSRTRAMADPSIGGSDASAARFARRTGGPAAALDLHVDGTLRRRIAAVVPGAGPAREGLERRFPLLVREAPPSSHAVRPLSTNQAVQARDGASHCPRPRRHSRPLVRGAIVDSSKRSLVQAGYRRRCGVDLRTPSTGWPASGVSSVTPMSGGRGGLHQAAADNWSTQTCSVVIRRDGAAGLPAQVPE